MLTFAFNIRTVRTALTLETSITVGTTDSVELTLDPAQTYDYFGWCILQQIAGTLVSVKPGSTTGTDFVPDLALSWNSSADLKTWDFQLRQGVKFPDGTTFNATHVKDSFDRAIALIPSIPEGAPAALGYDAIFDQTEVLSTYKVRFHLKFPFSPLLGILACRPSSIVDPNYAPVAKVNYTAGNPRASTPVAFVGPYVLSKWERVGGRDVAIILDANPTYWNLSSGYPKLKQIVFKFYPDAATLRTAIEAWDVDMAFRHISPTDVLDLQNNPNLRVWWGDGTFIQYLCFQQKRVPFNDTRVRVAVAAALNRTEVTNTVFLGLANPLYSIIPPGMLGHTEAFKALEDTNVNYALTKSLLAEVGYDETNKLTFELWYESSGHYPSSAEQALLYKEALEASGVISVTLKSADWASYRVNRDNEIMDAYVYGWYPDYVDPDDCSFLYWAAWLHTNYSNATQVALYDQARATTNTTLRAQLYAQIDDIAVQQCSVVPLYVSRVWAVTKPNICGIYLDITQDMRYWLIYSGLFVPPFVNENKLVYESGTTYQWLDPHVAYYPYDFWTLWHSVETLLWYERDNATKIIPWLAESYTVSPDRRHYDFTLRQGITFQDGMPFNATAVWFSLNRLLIIDGTSGNGLIHGSQAACIVQQLLNKSLAYGLTGSNSLGAKTNYDPTFVKAVLDQNFVEILGNYKVRLNLLTPSTQFLPIMAGPWASIVSPTSTIKMDYEHGGWGTWDGNYTKYFEHMAGRGETGLVLPENGWKVGTGPYYVESVQPTTYGIVLKAYNDYWGGPSNMNLPPEGKTRIEKVEFKYVPSFATTLLDLKAGRATGIAVPATSIFQVVDRDKWLDQGILESIIPNVVEHGPFSQFATLWLCFNTNVTKSDGTLKDWQPFSDWRIRMAVASSVNITEMNMYVNDKLGIVANSIVPPDTFPPGSYNPNVKPTFSFNLTKTRELLLAANATPLATFTYYNGTPIPSGKIDNSFGLDFNHAKAVEFYVQSGADTLQQVLATMATNLNTIAYQEDLGIRFNVVIVPQGQQYVLASAHLIDSYIGGWIADYNHVLNWLAPMYRSTGTYFSWNLWNLTALDVRYDQAVAADQAGDTDELLRLSDEMNTIANEALTYMVWWHPTLQFARSAWLKGWYVNTVYGVDLWSTMYYENPFDVTPPVTAVSLGGVQGENGWFTSNVKVTLSATDDTSGVDKIERSFDNATWTTYTESFTVSAEGITTIYCRSTDKAGNPETTKTKTVKIDKTIPSGSIMIDNDAVYANSTSVTLTLTATDVTSGVYQVRYSNDGVWDGEPWESSSPAKTWTLAYGDGIKTVFFQIKDYAGLISGTHSDNINLDTAPPTGSITINNGATYASSSSATLTLSSEDATSGVISMRLSNDNATWTPWEAYSTSRAWTLTAGDGMKTVYVQYVDAAGWTSQSYSSTVTLDTGLPTITITSPILGQEIKSSAVAVTWTCSDETSGMSHCEIRVDDDSWINVGTNTTHEFTGLGDGAYMVEVKAYDQAGLTSVDSVEFVVNTSPLFGPGYIEEAAIVATIIIALIAVAVYFIKFRK